MKAASYIISEKALHDLEEIWLYTLNNWSLQQADRYYEMIVNEIKYVAANFESGKSVNHIRKGYKAAKVKSHIIFYRKGEDYVVEVIRILHQKMDIESRLK